MPPAAASPRPVTPRRPSAEPVRPSGVMPAFRGKVSLPTPSLPAPSLKLAPKVDNDEALWAEALAAAKKRAEQEDEERAWQQAIARAKALTAAQEEREWAALRARAAAPRKPAPRLVSWP
ncbi:MAG: hypothetical protein ABW352_09205 [Polyangiales bacterium]